MSLYKKVNKNLYTFYGIAFWIKFDRERKKSNYIQWLVSVHQFVPSQKPQQFTPILKVLELNYNNFHICKNAIIKR